MSSAPMRRGACPTLSAPMRTGDGWLARVAVVEMTAAQLGGLARVAARLGNGIVEVTARGSLQLRGLGEGGGAALAAALGDLAIDVAEGLPVVTGALAGVDPGEIADPRPLAAALRAGAAGMALLPKVTLVVDGGGALSLDAVAADLRLVAVPDGWRVAVADRLVGTWAADGAVAAALGLLRVMAERGLRGRDLAVGPDGLAMSGEPLGDGGPFGIGGPVLDDPRTAASDRAAVGCLPGAWGFGLPFGQVEAGMLAALARVAGAVRFRPAPRALVAVGADAGLVAAAERLGFVTLAEDPRLRVVACPGAPACAAGCLATRAIAAEIARVAGNRIAPGWRLHLSGCAKRCAQPVGPAVTLVGTAGGWHMTGEGMAVPPEMRALLGEMIGRRTP